MNPPPAGPAPPTDPELATEPVTDSEPESESAGPGSKRGLVVVGLAVATAVGLVAAATLAYAGVWGVAEPAPAPAQVTLDDVVTYEDLPTTHTEKPVTYDQSPAVGGPHARAWLDCGTYDEPVREENVVHDLEHGTVWFAVSEDLDPESLAALGAMLPDNGILAPYPGLDAPAVVTVWGAQLRLTGAEDPRLPLFLAAYGNGRTAPEPMASCDGGLSDPDGETPTTTAV